MLDARVDWRTNRVETAGESTEYISQPLLELVAHRRVKTRRVTKENNRWILEGDGTEPLRVGRAGQYLVEATTRDKEGRDVVTSATLYVSGEDRKCVGLSQRISGGGRADKETYRAGETATLRSKLPSMARHSSPLNVRTFFARFSVPLKGTAQESPFRLKKEMHRTFLYPSCFLARCARAREKLESTRDRVGYCELKVERPQAKLNVYVKAAAGKCQPGDEVTVDCEVLDFEGRPVR